jgi:hypothetical protein
MIFAVEQYFVVLLKMVLVGNGLFRNRIFSEVFLGQDDTNCFPLPHNK